MPKKNPGEVRARTYDTEWPSRLEALRIIDSVESQKRREVGKELSWGRAVLGEIDVLVTRCGT